MNGLETVGHKLPSMPVLKQHSRAAILIIELQMVCHEISDIELSVSLAKNG